MPDLRACVRVASLLLSEQKHWRGIIGLKMREQFSPSLMRCVSVRDALGQSHKTLSLVLSHLSFIYISENNTFLCQILFAYLPQGRWVFLTVNGVSLLFIIITNHQIKDRRISFVLIW